MRTGWLIRLIAFFPFLRFKWIIKQLIPFLPANSNVAHLKRKNGNENRKKLTIGGAGPHVTVSLKRDWLYACHVTVPTNGQHSVGLLSVSGTTLPQVPPGGLRWGPYKSPRWDFWIFFSLKFIEKKLKWGRGGGGLKKMAEQSVACVSIFLPTGTWLFTKMSHLNGTKKTFRSVGRVLRAADNGDESSSFFFFIKRKNETNKLVFDCGD